MPTFDENYYLSNKATQLNNAGKTYNGDPYTRASVMQGFTDAGLTPQQHYEKYGQAEGISPYHYFDESSYYNNKANQLNKTGVNPATGQAWSTDDVKSGFANDGLSYLQHYEQYGKNEGISGYKDNSNSSAPSDANTLTDAPISSLGDTTPDDRTAPKTLEDFSSNQATFTPETFNNPKPYTVPETDTVQGRMGGLLDQNSQYMQTARETGKREAAGRGLLNSNLAGQYGEKAAIESALPIAQQDSASRVEAGMADYNSRSTAAQSILDYNQDAAITGVQEGASSRLSDQTADQNSDISAQEAAQAADLSLQQSLQNMEELAAQYGYEEALTIVKQAGEQVVQTAEILSTEYINNLKLDADEKSILFDTMETWGNEYLAQMNSINTNDTLDSTGKATAIQNLSNFYKTNLDMISTGYNVPINWEPLVYISEEDNPEYPEIVFPSKIPMR